MPLVISPESYCHVCYKDLNVNAIVPHSLACGHAFCRDCLVKHLTKSQYHGCPDCRRSYARKDDVNTRPNDKVTEKDIAKAIKPIQAQMVDQEMRELLFELTRSALWDPNDERIGPLNKRVLTWYKRENTKQPGSRKANSMKNQFMLVKNNRRARSITENTNENKN